MTNKEAIEILSTRLERYCCTDEDIKALDLAIEALKNTPKKGKWLYTPPDIKNGVVGACICSICGKTGYTTLNFCSYCGADMREVVKNE